MRIGGWLRCFYLRDRTGNRLQCDAINKAFQEAGKQKVKDMFSKVQRKKVDEWASGTADVAENIR